MVEKKVKSYVFYLIIFFSLHFLFLLPDRH